MAKFIVRNYTDAADAHMTAVSMLCGLQGVHIKDITEIQEQPNLFGGTDFIFYYRKGRKYGEDQSEA